jgi:DNA adenine methylase
MAKPERWEVYISKKGFEKIRSDPRLATLLTLARIVNALNFCFRALIKSSEEWTLNSREEFTDMKKQRGLTDIQRAARWYTIQTLSFGGDGDSFAVTRKSGGGANRSRHRLLERVAEISDRLDRVNIEHLDWRRCIDLYDSDETFFFIDPPYTGGKIKNYGAWAIQDLEQMRITLDSLHAEWLLTINDCAESRGIFEGLRIRSLKRARGIANKTGSRTEYGELLISKA